MKSTTLLDSAVFHLTPTRTRCDLIIITNGKKEKIASGLLNPFLAHLKTAQDQIEKGGYSILLEPDPDDEATWFTKGTVERFVRFVSTPEILERVYTLEAEILQIEEAIAIQGTNDAGQSFVEEYEKPNTGMEAHKLKPDVGEERAIVLYSPGAHQPQTKGEKSLEENSRVQLLKVLEARKTVLRKEQGMAFARAVAAGFEVDNMDPLVSFSKCYGASRLMDACIRFADLWKRKHEDGQWLEIEAAESMSGHENSFVNSSGIVLSSVANKDSDSNGDYASAHNQKPPVDIGAGERPTVVNQVPLGHQESFQGPFPGQIFPTWPIQSPPGIMPMFAPYPVQGMPYYQAFPGNVPFYQPPHPQMEDYRLNATPRTGEKRQSMDGGDGNQNRETGDLNSSKSSSPDGVEFDKEASRSWKSQKKAGRSRKNQSGVVVIRNINYIASEAKTSAGAESSSDSETGNEGHDVQDDNSDLVPSNDNIHANQSDYGNWQAFQSFLLNGADEDHTNKEGLFTIENDAHMKRRIKRDGVDPLTLVERDSAEIRERGSRALHEVNGKVSRKSRAFNDAIMFSDSASHSVEGQNDEINMHSAEANGRRIVSRTSEDNFLGNNRDQYNLSNSSDPLAFNGSERPTRMFDGVSSHDIGDESFIVPFRSTSVNQVGAEDRTAIDMDYELPSAHQKSEDNGIRRDVSCEPDDLNLLPERGSERRSFGYDPALDYELQIYDDGSVSKSAEKVKNNAKKGTSRLDGSQKSKISSDSTDKRRTGGPMRKPKPSKMTPLEDARARADKLRAFKTDIQKLKKEKEDADLKRLEALKLERQKRIAARNNPSTVGSTAPQVQMRKAPPKLSPITNRGSKFSDLETGSSSPLQRSKVRTTVGSSESQASRSGKSIEGSLLPGNKLSRSVPSLPVQKKDNSNVTPESKASAARIRRLSEPKTVGHHSTPATKVHRAEPALKVKSDAPDSKKISAIINLDKRKAASLPELKIRTPKGPSDLAERKSTEKDEMKLHEVKPPPTSEKFNSHSHVVKSPMQNEADDNPIIDKAVVVLEYDRPSIPVVHGSGNEMRAHNSQYDNRQIVEERRTVSEFTSIRAPPSPNDVLHRDPKPDHLPDQSNLHEVGPYNTVGSSKFSSMKPAQKPYAAAPFAQKSSLEGPGSRNSDFAEATSVSSETMTTAKAYVIAEKSNKIDNTPETSDKIQVKESPKGFKRLLKFGKKNHSATSVDESLDSETSNVTPASKVSSEVHSLKHLISEDETPIQGNSSNKSASRHFSLLSPFRSKTSEKKSTT